MAYSTTKFLKAAYQVTYNSVVLGYTTREGVKLTVTSEKTKVEADQFGIGAVDFLTGGESAQLSFELEQWDTSGFKVAFPHAIKFVDGSDERITFGRQPGVTFLDRSYELLLHRYRDAGSDTSKDIKFYKAVVATDAFEQTYNSQGLTVIPLTFDALVDTSKSDGQYLFEIGTTNASTAVSS